MTKPTCSTKITGNNTHFFHPIQNPTWIRVLRIKTAFFEEKHKMLGGPRKTPKEEAPVPIHTPHGLVTHGAEKSNIKKN